MNDLRDIKETENKKWKIGDILSFSKRHTYIITVLLVVVLSVIILLKFFYRAMHLTPGDTIYGIR
jgi:hypothetical protein